MTDTAIATRESWQKPTTFKEAQDLAKYLSEWGRNAIPKAYQSDPGAIMVAIAVGESLGLDAVIALQSLHVIHGKVQMDATFMRGRAMQLPACEYFLVNGDHATAKARVRRTGWPEKHEEVYEVTIEDAQRGKWGMKGGSWSPDSSWKKDPRSMLIARATTRACRAAFPEVFANVYSPEEIVEVEAEVVPEPEPVAQQPEETKAEAMARAAKAAQVEANAEVIDAGTVEDLSGGDDEGSTVEADPPPTPVVAAPFPLSEAQAKEYTLKAAGGAIPTLRKIAAELGIPLHGKLKLESSIRQAVMEWIIEQTLHGSLEKAPAEPPTPPQEPPEAEEAAEVAPEAEGEQEAAEGAEEDDTEVPDDWVNKVYKQIDAFCQREDLPSRPVVKQLEELLEAEFKVQMLEELKMSQVSEFARRFPSVLEPSQYGSE